MLYIKRLLLALATASFLAGCGGGGGGGTPVPSYTGTTTPAAITSTNAADLGKSSGEATNKAVTQNTANDANPFAVSIDFQNTVNGDNLLSTVATSIYNDLKNASDTGNLPTGVAVSYTSLGPYYCGGSVSAPDSFGSGGLLNGTVTINNLCYDDPYDSIGAVTLNGTMTFSETASQLSMTFNVRVTQGTDTQSVNMGITCQLDIYGVPTSCSLTSDFVGNDGRVYRIADFSIYESLPGSGSYDFNGTLYHPDHGYVTVNATGITFGCTNGKPNGGTITFTGVNSSSGDITFRSDCTGYDGHWNDGIAAGTFSGNWL